MCSGCEVNLCRCLGDNGTEYIYWVIFNFLYSTITYMLCAYLVIDPIQSTKDTDLHISEHEVCFPLVVEIFVKHNIILLQFRHISTHVKLFVTDTCCTTHCIVELCVVQVSTGNMSCVQ